MMIATIKRVLLTCTSRRSRQDMHSVAKKCTCHLSSFMGNSHNSYTTILLTHMRTFGLTIALILHFTSTQSQQCAYGYSYCLSGLKIDDFNSFICTQYLSETPLTFNNCSYFKSLDGIFIYKDTTTRYWLVHTNISNSIAYAYCKEDILDNCGKSKWYYFDGKSTNINHNMEVKQCSYNNTLCEASHSENDTYCIANTTHRSINAVISGQYAFKGCHMEQPYFVQPINFTTDGIVNFTISWDDILTSWCIDNALGSAYIHYAYCTKSEITECDGNWYVYDGSGQGSNLDKNVKSGYCNSFVLICTFP